MPRSESYTPGAEVTHNQERTSTGLLTQGGVGTRGTPTFSADNDQQYGKVQCWVAKSVSTADQAYENAATITNVFGGTKVARNEKYRIIHVDTVIRVKRTGGTRATATKIEKGDGASTESFSDLVASIVDTSDTVNSPVSQALVNAQTLLLTGETLRIQHEVAGSTTTGTEELDVYVYAIPVKS